MALLLCTRASEARRRSDGGGIPLPNLAILQRYREDSMAPALKDDMRIKEKHVFFFYLCSQLAAGLRDKRDSCVGVVLERVMR